MEDFDQCRVCWDLIMGLKISKQRRNRSSRGGLSSNLNGSSGLSNVEHLQYYTPQHHNAPARRHFRTLTPPHRCMSSYDYQQSFVRPGKNFGSKYSRIADNYQTLDQVSYIFCYLFWLFTCSVVLC